VKKKRYFSQFIIHTSLWCIKCSWCSLKKEKLLTTKTENKLKDLRQDKEEFKSGKKTVRVHEKVRKVVKVGFLYSLSSFGSSGVEGLSSVPAFVET